MSRISSAKAKVMACVMMMVVALMALPTMAWAKGPLDGNFEGSRFQRIVQVGDFADLALEGKGRIGTHEGVAPNIYFHTDKISPNNLVVMCMDGMYDAATHANEKISGDKAAARAWSISDVGSAHLILKFPGAACGMGTDGKYHDDLDYIVRVYGWSSAGGYPAEGYSGSNNPAVQLMWPKDGDSSIVITSSHWDGMRAQAHVEIFVTEPGAMNTVADVISNKGVFEPFDGLGLALWMEDIDQPDNIAGFDYYGDYAESVQLTETASVKWDKSAIYLISGTWIDSGANAIDWQGDDWAMVGYITDSGGDPSRPGYGGQTDYGEDSQLTGFVAFAETGKISYTWRGSMAGSELMVTKEPPFGYLGVQKKSTQESWCDSLATYSRAGAVYGVWGAPDCAGDPMHTFTTFEDGSSDPNEVQLNPGTYYVKEISPSLGHGLDSEIHAVAVNPGTHNVVESTEPALYTTFSVILSKADPNFGALDASGDSTLADYVYRLRYWDAEPARASGAVKAQAGFKTNASGEVEFSGASPADGMWPYVVGNMNQLPIGTYTLSEYTLDEMRRAGLNPPGYHVTGEMQRFEVYRAEYSNDYQAHVRGWSGDKIAGVRTIEGRNSAWSMSQVDNWRGSVTVRKVDKDWYDAGDYERCWGPEGDATFAGVTFTLTNRSARHVMVHGKEYYVGEVIASGSIMSDADPTVSFDDLPYGTYELTETAGNMAGYFADTSFSTTFSIREDKQHFGFTGAGDAAKDKVWRGGLRLLKVDYQTWEDVAQGNATLEGAVFDIYNISEHEVYVYGSTHGNRVAEDMGTTYPTYKPQWEATGQVPANAVPVATIETNGLFRAGLDVTMLPYGTYVVKERSAPDGYLIASRFGNPGVVFTIRQDGQMADFDTVDIIEKMRWYWNPATDAWDDTWGAKPNDLPRG